MIRLIPRNQPVVASGLVAVYLLILSALGFGGYLLLKAPAPVLLTDGGSLLHLDRRLPPDQIAVMTDLQHKIHAANVEAAGRAHHVTIVYALPFWTPDPGRLTSDIPQLQAAYIAQRQVNHPANDPLVAGAPPLVLELGVTGDGIGWSRALTDQILEHRDRDHIIAVAGLGPSDGITTAELQRLGRADISTIAAVSTSDGFYEQDPDKPDDSRAIPRFARVSSPNTDEAKALVNGSRDVIAKASRVVLLAGTMGHGHDDGYVTTFVTAFQNALHPRTLSPLPFDPDRSADPHDATMAGYAASVCPPSSPSSGPRPSSVVLFAGRHKALITLLAALDVDCTGTRVTILTGDDAALTVVNPKDPWPASAVADALDTKVSVEFAAHTEPGQWDVDQAGQGGRTGLPRPHLLIRLQQDLRNTLGVEATDQAIVGYDAMLTAISAAAKGGNGRTQLNAKDLPLWPSFRCPNAIAGAGGVLSFDTSGNPVDKPVPIVRLQPDQGHRKIEVLRVGRTGSPQFEIDPQHFQCA